MFTGLALLLGVLAAAHSLRLIDIRTPPGVGFAVLIAFEVVVAFTVCVHATVNLMRDVGRGYSPARCSLAAILLLFAFGLSLWSGIFVLSFIFA